MKKNAFTLVELLVAIAVLSIIGILVLTIFTNALRGSNKAQILSAIQKNGRSVLETMDKTIRNSDNLVCISNEGTLLVVVKDGVYTRYKFFAPTTSVNGQIKQDNPEKESEGNDPVTEMEYTDPAFKNEICADEDLLSDPITLTDSDTDSGVSVSLKVGTKAFAETPSSGFKNQVTIQFDASQGVQAASFLTGQIDPVNFVTTISLR